MKQLIKPWYNYIMEYLLFKNKRNTFSILGETWKDLLSYLFNQKANFYGLPSELFQSCDTRLG
jgi:hypothetical protein